MVLYYLTSSGTNPHIPIMAGLKAWNFAVGFGVMLLGLVMAVRWR
jgi:hydrogenase-4 membrane subunit HyfE